MTGTPTASNKLMITVAPTGAETSKEECAALPTTLPEIAETAQRCQVAGAAMVHVHNGDDEHRPTLDPGRLRATVEALRESTDVVVRLSTGGSVHDPLADRLKVLDAEPDSCSLTMGTTNFAAIGVTLAGTGTTRRSAPSSAPRMPSLAQRPLPPRSRPRALLNRAGRVEVSVSGTRSLDPTGGGRTRGTMSWKPALNAFAITFADRWPAAEAY